MFAIYYPARGYEAPLKEENIPEPIIDDIFVLEIGEVAIKKKSTFNLRQPLNFYWLKET
jgi:hypothetical protein